MPVPTDAASSPPRSSDATPSDALASSTFEPRSSRGRLYLEVLDTPAMWVGAGRLEGAPYAPPHEVGGRPLRAHLARGSGEGFAIGLLDDDSEGSSGAGLPYLTSAHEELRTGTDARFLGVEVGAGYLDRGDGDYPLGEGIVLSGSVSVRL